MKVSTPPTAVAATTALFALLATLNSHAAFISWGVPTPIVGDTDVSLNGTLVFALNYHDPNTSVNSVLFFGVHPPLPSLNTGSVFAPFTDLSTSYQVLLRTALSGEVPTTFRLGGLAVGMQYELQLWAHDSDEGRGAYLSQENYPNADVFVPGRNQGGLGSHVIGTFTADSNFQLFAIGTQGETWVLNAVQLRRLDSTTDIPEASTTVAGLLLAFGTCGVWYRRRMIRR